jgi:hypothetical protein
MSLVGSLEQHRIAGPNLDKGGLENHHSAVATILHGDSYRLRKRA